MINRPFINQGINLGGCSRPLMILTEKGVDIRTGATYNTESLLQFVGSCEIVVIKRNIIIPLLRHYLMDDSIVDFEISPIMVHNAYGVDLRRNSIIHPTEPSSGAVVYVTPIYDRNTHIIKLEKIISDKRRELESLEKQLSILKGAPNENIQDIHVMTGSSVTDYNIK